MGCGPLALFASLFFYLHPFDFVHIYTVMVNPIISRVDFMVIPAKLLLVNVAVADFPNERKSGHTRSLLLMNLSRTLQASRQAQKKRVLSKAWMPGRPDC
jgi:hypothetical protein